MAAQSDIIDWLNRSVNAISSQALIIPKTTKADALACQNLINNTSQRRMYIELKQPYTSQEFTLVARAKAYDGAWIVIGEAHWCQCKCEQCLTATLISKS